MSNSRAIKVRFAPSSDNAALSNVTIVVAATALTVGDFIECVTECGNPRLAGFAKDKKLVLVHRGVTLAENETLSKYDITDNSTLYAFGKAIKNAATTQDGNALLRELYTLFHSLFMHPAFHTELDAVVNDPRAIETALGAAFPDCTPAERDVFAEPILRNVHIYYVLMALRNSPNVLRTLSVKRSWLLRGLLSIGTAVRERVEKRSRDDVLASGAPFGFGAVDYEEAAEQQQQQQRVAAAQRPGDPGSRIRRHPQFLRPYGTENTAGAAPRNDETATTRGHHPSTGGSISSEWLAAALSRAQAGATSTSASASPSLQTASVSTPRSVPPPESLPSSTHRDALATPSQQRPGPAVNRISNEMFASAIQHAQQVSGSSSDTSQPAATAQSSDLQAQTTAGSQAFSAAPQQVVTDRELYASQISMLKDMGVSEEAALEALRACDGDFDAVLQFLFGGTD